MLIARWAGLLVILAMSCVLVATPAAQANTEMPISVDRGGSLGQGAMVAVKARHGASSNAAVNSVPASSNGESAMKRTCQAQGRAIPCTSDQGVWFAGRQCYVRSRPVTPDHPFNGHEDGAAYWCRPAYLSNDGQPVDTVGSGYTFWAPSPGTAGAPQLVDPVSLAQRAVEHMQLTAPRIGMTPMRPGAPLLVGMDAWLWVENADNHGFGPITRTASAGPTSVTATGRVTKVAWDLGDGTQMTCPDAGTRWSPARGTGPSPTCGHRYLAPSSGEANGAFTVRATTHWQVDWTGAGQSGQLTFTLTGQREQVVTEVQVLQTA